MLLAGEQKKHQRSKTSFHNMSTDWCKDIAEMHTKFGTNAAVAKMDKTKLLQFLDFRIKCMYEELDETNSAFRVGDKDGIVDGIVDLLVFSIGTLDAFGVDANLAWDRVLEANMSKSVGIKEGRDNPYGLPDLIKPKDFRAPDHNDNLGLLP